MAARTGCSPPGLQWTRGAGCQNPRSFGVAEEPPGPGSDSSYTQVLQAALGLCVSSGVLPLQRSNGIHSPATAHTSLPPCSCFRHTPLPGARCGPQSGCCPISDRSLKDLIPLSQLFTPRWCCPSALPRCPITIGELPKSPSRNFTGFGTHLGWRDTDTFYSFRIEEEGGSR